MSTLQSDKSDLPCHLHEFIEHTTTCLKRLLCTDSQESYPEPHTVNLLWHNAIIGAEIHFTPWTTGVKKSDIGGPESGYFARLLELAPLPVPTAVDISLLAEHLARSPQAAGAIMSLGPRVSDVLGWKFTGIRTFARATLDLFCDCVRSGGVSQQRACEALTLLGDRNLLLPIIHVLLGVIPQYPFARGPLLSSCEGWISSKTKLKAWDNAKLSGDAATAMFVLLSTVESLQWHTGYLFYTIPNVLNFLRTKIADPMIRAYLQHQSLSLCNLSLYVTMRPDISEEQATAFESTLKEHLVHWTPALCNLVRAVNNATLKSSLDTYDELNDWISLGWARGLLTVAAPENISFAQDYISQDGSLKTRVGIRNRMSDEELAIMPVAPGIPSEVAKSLVDPWGIYREKPGVVEVDGFPFSDSGVPYYKRRGKTFFMTAIERGLRVGVSCSLDKSNTVFENAISNSWFCAGDLLQDVYTTSSTISHSPARDWYKRAFGTFYFHFDQRRHKDVPSTDLKIRQAGEAAFYARSLRSVVSAKGGKLDVLDIGMGYGRLERAISEEDPELFSNIRFWGLDISLEMRRRQAEFFQELDLGERYRIGEMSEVLELYMQERFNAIILAFATFGCYENDEDNASVLKKITTLLDSGGILILEHFNPAMQQAELPYWSATESIDDRCVTLEKTTKMIPISSMCTLYTGEYIYSECTRTGPRVLRRDEYCIRLYSREWIAQVLRSAGFKDKDFCFKADFTDAEYKGSPKESILVCEVHKPESAAGPQAATDEMLSRAKRYLEVSSAVIEQVREARGIGQGKEMYKFLYQENMTRALNTLEEKSHLLNEDNLENARRVTAVGQTDFDAMNEALGGGPKQWRKGDLLLHALLALLRLLDS